MKTASTGLLALLASRQFFAVDLFQFTLTGGATLNYCSGDQDITWNSIVWNAGGTTGPYLIREGARAKCHWKTGIEVDTLVFDVLPSSSTIQGLPFLTAVQQGVFDGAEMTLYRAFMPSYGNTAEGTVLMFAGRVAEIDVGRSLATFTVNSHLELLNQNLPRNLYQAGCLNTLFDAACGLNAESFAIIGVAGATSLAYNIKATLSQESGYFDLGKIVFTSGLNNGLSRTVKTYVKGTPGSVHLIAPFPNAPSVGDSFKLYPGCDKRQNTCSDKFNNLARFRGFPYIPENATAV
jgi:uncharacterized phage protein (TIGR02218 family)